MKLSITIVVLALASVVLGDMYMHNPPGMNNRVDDNNNAPANRMFDSQNNNQAGYNVGEQADRLKFYVGSQLMVQWTSQHGCGINPQTHCDVIVQWRCDAAMRDGTSRNRPDADGNTAADGGIHEPYENWSACETRERNGGLFIADQNVGNEASSTRQNAGGGRSGYECAEERDYYPYWHGSYFKDIAVMTDNTSRCDYYQAESQNVMAKGECSNVADNNPDACSANGGSWNEVPSFGLDAPLCVLAPFNRANQHADAMTPGTGDALGRSHAHLNISIPDDVSSACILRLRYNITTDDYDGWDTFASSNGDLSPVEDDPDVDIGIGQELQLNINTAQFGRTFEDRSVVFQIIERPDDVDEDTMIYNLNVRGKRGNNANTYPAMEYDFAPDRFHVEEGEYIHWQWTGSNNNNNGNDRNNAVQIESYAESYPMGADDNTMFENNDQIKSAATSCGSTDENLQDVDPYCDVGLVQMNDPGTYHYMSTKNNAYSNRSQKGTIVVDDSGLSLGIIIAIIIGALAVVGAGTAGAVVYKKKYAGSKRF